jgi:hypothetical protein
VAGSPARRHLVAAGTMRVRSASRASGDFGSLVTATIHRPWSLAARAAWTVPWVVPEPETATGGPRG